jgi:Flp pilus assembly protein TadD
MEAALALRSDEPHSRENLAMWCNNLAWHLATGPVQVRNVDRALALVRRALSLAPGNASYLNTLSVVQYRSGRYAEAAVILEQSLTASAADRATGVNLLFLAMARHRSGRLSEARAFYDRAVRWLGEQQGLTSQAANDFATFRTEAETVLASQPGDLPLDPFAPE